MKPKAFLSLALSALLCSSIVQTADHQPTPQRGLSVAQWLTLYGGVALAADYGLRKDKSLFAQAASKAKELGHWLRNGSKNGRWEDLKEHVGTHKRKYVVALILALAVAIVKSKQRRELTKAVVNTTSATSAGPPEAPPTAAPAPTPPSSSHTDTRVLQPDDPAIAVGSSFFDWDTFVSAKTTQEIETIRDDTEEKIFIVGSAFPLNTDGSLNVQVLFFEGSRRYNARIYKEGVYVMLERLPGYD